MEWPRTVSLDDLAFALSLYSTRTCVGTCATPEPHDEERPDTFTGDEWKALYARGKKLLNTNLTAFSDSIRHDVVKKTLTDAYRKEHKDRKFINLPLAVERRVTRFSLASE